MLNLLIKANNLEEIGLIFLDFWSKSDIDSFSEKNLNDLKKVLLEKNYLTLVKKITPLSRYAYNRFNLTRAIISSLPDCLIREELRFALWHRLIQHKTIGFLEKVKGNEEMENKISFLLDSLNSLLNFRRVKTKEELSKYFVVLSDLTGQLGFHIFSIISAKNSLKNNNNLVDATIFLGKAYMELGTTFANKVKNKKIKDNQASSLDYNFHKSQKTFRKALIRSNGKLKEEINSLLMSISTVVDEITIQRQKGKNTIVQIVVEDYISNRLEQVEDEIIRQYENSDIQFPTNIKVANEHKVMALEDESMDVLKNSQDNQYSNQNTLNTFKNVEKFNESVQKKPGKLFNIYNNANKIEKKPVDIEQSRPKQGTIKSDKIGYKLSLEDLQKIIKKKNEEFNKNK